MQKIQLPRANRKYTVDFKDSRASRIQFGEYAGTLWTRIPRSYLFRLIKKGGNAAKKSREELDRRGVKAESSSSIVTITVSGHAIDRASQKILGMWRRSRSDKDEGLYSWMMRKALESRENGKAIECGVFLYENVRWVFTNSAEDNAKKQFVLKTVIPVNSTFSEDCL